MHDPTPDPRPPIRAPAWPPHLERLHPRAVTLWRIAGVGRTVTLGAAALAGEWLIGTPLPFGIPALVIAAASLSGAIFVPPLRYRAWGFTLRDTDLYLRHGILFRTTSIVPHARIQHVDTRHGPIDRWLGLAELVVFTAGSRGAIVSIPALGREAAESLRDRLAALSGAGDAV